LSWKRGTISTSRRRKVFPRNQDEEQRHQCRERRVGNEPDLGEDFLDQRGALPCCLRRSVLPGGGGAGRQAFDMIEGSLQGFDRPAHKVQPLLDSRQCLGEPADPAADRSGQQHRGGNK